MGDQNHQSQIACEATLSKFRRVYFFRGFLSIKMDFFSNRSAQEFARLHEKWIKDAAEIEANTSIKGLDSVRFLARWSLFGQVAHASLAVMCLALALVLGMHEMTLWAVAAAWAYPALQIGIRYFRPNEKPSMSLTL